MAVELSPSLHRTGLPLSVLAVIQILSGANLLRALQLTEDYKRNILAIDRLQIDAAVREAAARAAIADREKPAKPTRLNLKAIQLREAERSLLA